MDISKKKQKMEIQRAVELAMNEIVELTEISPADLVKVELKLPQMFAAGLDSRALTDVPRYYNNKKQVSMVRGTEVLGTFPSISLAARRVKLDRRRIHKSLRTGIPNRNGIRWMYEK